MAAVYGIDLVEATETVEAVIDQGELCIVTDHKVYTFPQGTTPVVEVGDTVLAGQSMIAEFQIWSSPRQPLPDVAGIMVPAALLAFDAVGDIVFPNTLVSVARDLDSRAVSFELQGDSSDVDQFWDAAGEAVADFFWQTYSKIPSQVNPAEFLLRHVWRQRCIIVAVGSLEPVVVASAAVLRKIQPPHVLVLFADIVGGTGAVDDEDLAYLLAAPGVRLLYAPDGELLAHP
jgi:hypothetical protein